MNNELQDAMNQSMDQDEITRCEFSGDEAALVAELSAMYDGDVGSVRENDGTIDVWGFHPGVPDGEMDWRLKATLTH